MISQQYYFVVSQDRKIFVKDRANGLYSCISYFTARVLSAIPTVIFSISLYTVVMFYIIGLNDVYAFKFYHFWLFNMLGSVVATLFALFIGTLSADSNVTASLTLVRIILKVKFINNPFFLVSGFYRETSYITPIVYPLKLLSVNRYLYRIMVSNEFSENMRFCGVDQETQADSCIPILDDNYMQGGIPDSASLCILGILYFLVTFSIVYFKIKR